MSSAQPVQQPSHRGAPTPSNMTAAVSPPSKRDLQSWWKKFSKKSEKVDEKVPIVQGIFGVPLAESIRYANVAISLTNDDGESFIYGYVPIVVAKCGVFLKEKATDVEGIFRLSGSAKRIKDLQAVFNSPPRYGKGLDWTGYTVHDAANILRRYLNQLPEPIVPLDFYERFREPLRSYHNRPAPEGEMQPIDMTMNEHMAAVISYQKLITELPPLNRQLLLYILDLLAVFASKSDLNRMTAANLAAIFQPGIISHPQHDMAPMEYRLSQGVLIFLIESQDNFLIGMSGTGIDETTKKNVESGPPTAVSPQANIGRSASNASGGADSLRRSGVRRNISASSHASRDRPSPRVSNPGTPPGSASLGSSIGLARSNTMPSKRSPALASGRFQRMTETSGLDSPSPEENIPANAEDVNHVQTTPDKAVSPSDTHPQPSQLQGTEQNLVVKTTQLEPFPVSGESHEHQTPTSNIPIPSSTTSSTPAQSATRERKISSLFSKSPIFGPTDPTRPTKKLQKRERLPGSVNDSAQKSQNSLHDDENPPPSTPTAPSMTTGHSAPDSTRTDNPSVVHTQATPIVDSLSPTDAASPMTNKDRSWMSGLKPNRSPAGSIHSKSSITDHSELEPLEELGSKTDKNERQSGRWRFSSSSNKPEDMPLAPPAPFGQHAGARGSNTSLGSSTRPRKSFTGDSQTISSLAPATEVSSMPSQDSNEPIRENPDGEKLGFLGKIRARMSQSREERREREAEKERAKSPPPRPIGDHGGSRSSLSAFAQEHFSSRGRSFDRSREDLVPITQAEPPAAPITSTVTMPPGPPPASGVQSLTEPKTGS